MPNKSGGISELWFYTRSIYIYICIYDLEEDAGETLEKLNRGEKDQLQRSITRRSEGHGGVCLGSAMAARTFSFFFSYFPDWVTLPISFPSTSLLTSTTLFSWFNSYLCDGDAGEASGWVRKAIGLLWWMHLDGTWSKVYERRYRVYRGPTCKHWKKYSYISGVPKITSQRGKEPDSSLTRDGP